MLQMKQPLSIFQAPVLLLLLPLVAARPQDVREPTRPTPAFRVPVPGPTSAASKAKSSSLNKNPPITASDMAWSFIPSCAFDCVNRELPELRNDKFDPCEKWGNEAIRNAIYGCVDQDPDCQTNKNEIFNSENEDACRKYSIMVAGLDAMTKTSSTRTPTRTPTSTAEVAATNTAEESPAAERVESNTSGGKKGGLSMGAIAGIVIGIIAILGLVGFIFMFRNWRNHRHQTRSMSLEPTSAMPPAAPWEQLRSHPPTPVWLEQQHTSYPSEPHDTGFRDVDLSAPRIDVSPPIGGPVMSHAPQHASFIVEEPMFSPVSPATVHGRSTNSSIVSPMGEAFYPPASLEPPQPSSLQTPVLTRSRGSSIISVEPPFSSDPAFERWSNRSPSPVSMISRFPTQPRVSSPGNLVRADSVAWRRELEDAAGRAAARVAEQSRRVSEQQEETGGAKKEGAMEKLVNRISGGEKK